LFIFLSPTSYSFLVPDIDNLCLQSGSELANVPLNPRVSSINQYPYWRVSMGEIVYFFWRVPNGTEAALELNHEQRLITVEFNVPLPSPQEIHLFSDKFSTMISQLQLQKQQF
jgi:hypothetical protein